MANFNVGDLIVFTYPAVHLQDTRAHDRYPKVLVLHTNWQGNVHGLNLNYLTEDEINTLRMVLDPYYEMKYSAALKQKNPTAYQELGHLLHGRVGEAAGSHSRMVKITSPRAFYLNIIKPFVMPRGWDPYRLYKPDKMTGIRILQKEYHMTGKDSYAQFQAQQRQKLAQMTPDQLAALGGTPQPGQQQQAPSRGIMGQFIDKFRGTRGPQLPTRTPSFHPNPIAPRVTEPIGTRGTTPTGPGTKK